MPGQQGRTALVTGANSGIGFQAAVELARHGAVVLMACRDAGRGADARDRLVRQVPAALLARPGSRVVTVSSIVHRFGSVRFDDLQREHGYGRWQAYSQSKLANALFTLELDRRLRAAGATTISVGAHPGYTSTGLMHSGPQLGGGVFAQVMGLAAPLTGQSAAHGALPVLRAATDPAVRGGDYYGPRGPAESRGAPRRVRYARTAYDERLARRLWQASEALTGTAFPA